MELIYSQLIHSFFVYMYVNMKSNHTANITHKCYPHLPGNKQPLICNFYKLVVLIHITTQFTVIHFFLHLPCCCQLRKAFLVQICLHLVTRVRKSAHLVV